MYLKLPTMSYRGVTFLELLSHTHQLGVPVVAYENCQIGEQIGFGSSMRVHNGTCKLDGKIEQRVAFKIPIRDISPNKPRNSILKDIFQDLRVMGGLNGHPHIVKLLAVSFNDLNPILILELAQCDMQKFLIDNKNVSWRTKLKFAYEIASALESLHKSSIVHGDVKGANILIFKGKSQDDFEARLSDFGYCATDMSVRGGRIPGFTPSFQAPECFDEELRNWIGKKTMDIYSYGLLVGQMARDGEPLCMDIEMSQRYKKTGEELRILLNSLPRDTPEEFQKLIKATVKREPAARASLDDIMKILQQSKLWDDELNRHCLAKIALASAARCFSENDLQNYEHIWPAELNEMSITPLLKKKLFLEYKYAAENNHDVHAQFFLGFCFIIGFGVEKNFNEAFRWLWPVAKLGNRKAQSIVGFLYAAGAETRKDCAEIAEWLNKEAETGTPHAMYCLGLFYENVKKDYKRAFEWYIKASNAGDMDAANCLGYFWRDGIGVEKNYVKATENFTKAAEGGHIGAMYCLACILHNGVGVNKDDQMAFYWFTQAANAGDPQSMRQLGICYVQGIGIDEKNYLEAIRWFNKAVDVGDLDAMRYLGTCFAKGIGTEKDSSKAIQWYTKAAEGGHMGAMRKLANIHETNKDYIKAIEWYTNLANAGNADALCALGRCYEAQQYYSQAAKMYNKAAKLHNAHATTGRSYDHDVKASDNQSIHPDGNQDLEGMFALGNCYINGIGIEKDYVKAVEYFTNAANFGYSKAMFYLGRIWLDGIGVERDNTKAIKWFEQAVDAENSDAMCDLGYCYETGNGVPENNIKARMLYQESARLGNATAMYNMGNSYRFGLLGLPRDLGKATEWLLKARESGDRDAEKTLKAYQRISRDRFEKELKEDTIGNNKKIASAH